MNNYLAEQCQKQGLIYVPSAGVFDADGTLLFIASDTPREGAVNLTHPRFADMEGWHSLYVTGCGEALVYSNPDPNAYTLYSEKFGMGQGLPDLRELSKAAGEVI